MSRTHKSTKAIESQNNEPLLAFGQRIGQNLLDFVIIYFTKKGKYRGRYELVIDELRQTS